MIVLGLLLSFIVLISANPLARNLILHEKIDHVPHGFTHNGPALESNNLNLRMALVSSDMAGLEKALYDVSTPSSALYGQHLSKEEVEAFVAPKPESISAVNKWLRSNGLTASPFSPAGDWISVSIPVFKANDLLGAEFSVFTHQDTGKQTIRTLSYSLPVALKGHVELVHPTTTFPIGFESPRFSTPAKLAGFATENTTQAVPSSCSRVTTPACLQALYGIPTTKATQASGRLGVTGLLDQFAQKADLTTFLKTLRPDLPSSTTFTLETVDGGSNPQGAEYAGLEADLDIQYTVGVASGIPVTFISVGSSAENGRDSNGFLDMTNALLSKRTPPQVLTTSYVQNENTISRALASKVCDAFMQLGARGTSILFGAGDGGVAGGHTSNCSSFLPVFPSGCPFVTSVGATTGISPETAASFSSGGFSNYFATPSYQNLAASTYLSTIGSTDSGKFNRTGRGYPDVSAQGERVQIVLGGKTVLVSGSSCSSPIFASVVALLNDRLIAAGKRPLGFLNPLLYSAAGKAAFTDITIGSNPGCGTGGFPSKKGWDPVTGLGTPKFASLLRVVEA